MLPCKDQILEFSSGFALSVCPVMESSVEPTRVEQDKWTLVILARLKKASSVFEAQLSSNDLKMVLLEGLHCPHSSLIDVGGKLVHFGMKCSILLVSLSCSSEWFFKAVDL